MGFPNAQKGVKNLWLAELISLIAAGITAITALVTMGMYGSSSVTGALTALGFLGFLTLLAGIAGIVAFVFMLLGINSAKIDEGQVGSKFFNQAFMFVLIGLGCSVLGAFIPGIVGTIIGVGATVLSILVTIYVIQGICAFARAFGNAEVEQQGKNTIMIYMCAEGACALFTLISGFLNEFNTARYVLALVGALASAAASVIYFLYLGKAKNMFGA